MILLKLLDAIWRYPMKKLFELFLFILFLAPIFSENTQNLLIMTGEFPPLTYSIDGKASGPSVEIVNYIQKELGTNYPIVFYPWSRGYEIVQKTKNSVLFSMTKTKDRENKFKWVGPIAKKRFSFFCKK